MTISPALVQEQRCHHLHGRRTTIVLEAAFWGALEQAAEELGMTASALVAEICADVPGRSQGQRFNQALRLWVVQYYRKATPAVSDHA